MVDKKPIDLSSPFNGIQLMIAFSLLHSLNIFSLLLFINLTIFKDPNFIGDFIIYLFMTITVLFDFMFYFFSGRYKRIILNNVDLVENKSFRLIDLGLIIYIIFSFIIMIYLASESWKLTSEIM